MGWVRCVGCEKLQRDFVARTFALIAPIRPVLHRISSSNETVPNTPKHYEMHQNMSLGSNGVDRVRSLWKITTRLRGTNFCNNCTSSPRFALNFLQLRNNLKCTQRLWNAKKTWVLEPMGWIGCVRCNKFWHDFMARNFVLIALVQYVLHHVSCSYEIIRNELKHCATHKNMSLGFNDVDRVRLLQKITTWLHGTNFCINCTSSPLFCTEFHAVT